MVVLFPVLIRSSGLHNSITVILTARAISKLDYNQNLSQSQLLNPVMIRTYMKACNNSCNDRHFCHSFIQCLWYTILYIYHIPLISIRLTLIFTNISLSHLTVSNRLATDSKWWMMNLAHWTKKQNKEVKHCFIV